MFHREDLREWVTEENRQEKTEKLRSPQMYLSAADIGCQCEQLRRSPSSAVCLRDIELAFACSRRR